MMPFGDIESNLHASRSSSAPLNNMEEQERRSSPLNPQHTVITNLYGDTTKERLRLLLDEPSSSRLAFWLAILVAFAIITSSIAAIVETVPVYYRSQPNLWFGFETCVVFIFTLEFILRLYAHSTTWRQLGRFCTSFYTVLDLVAILPYFFSILFYGSDSSSDMQKFTVLRMFRLLRLFRCYTFSSVLQLSMDALVLSIYKSVDALVALMVFITFVVVAFSTMMYFAERGIWDPIQRTFIDIDGLPSQFSSIPAAIYFVTEVMTTVGLGDTFPKTVMGRVIAVPLMLFSLLIIALPSIIVGRNFAESWAWLRSTRPVRPSLTIAPLTPNPTLSTTILHQPLRETHFLAELSSTQLATQTVDHVPASTASVAERGEIIFGILQELQRQNELIERILLAEHPHLHPSHDFTHHNPDAPSIHSSLLEEHEQQQQENDEKK